MGSRCYDCGEKFGRCYEHAGDDCPAGCTFGTHDCPGDWEGSFSSRDLIREVPFVHVPADESDAW